MNFPEKVTFKLIDEKTKRPIKNIAILLIMHAHKKNDYSVGPKISDNRGGTIFGKQDCLNEIESSRKFYLMDYFSSLDQCLPKVSIKIMTEEQIRYTVSEHRKFRDIYQKYWNWSEIFLKHLESCNNAKYLSKLYTFTEEQLWKNKIITIELMPVKTNSQN